MMTAPARAAPLLYRIESAASTVHFDADSTLHAFHGDSHEAEGEICFDDATGDAPMPGAVRFSVHSLKTGNGRRDSAMYAMFEEKRFPDIEWRASKILCPEGHLQERLCHAEGVLRMHGIEKPVNFDLTLRREAEGLRVLGHADVTTDMFLLVPPSVMGIVKVGKKIRIQFDTRWRPSAEPGCGKV